MEHSFDVEFAAEHGFAAAVIYRHFQFWIAHNKANGQNKRNGRTWTYNSARAFQELFPYLKLWDIRKAVKHLLQCGLLIKDHLGGGYDRTSWYAFGDEKTALKTLPAHLRNTQMDLRGGANGFAGGRKCIKGADKEPVLEPDNKKGYFQKGLSETEDQERGHSLLLQYGINAKTAKAIVYEQHTPVESIEEVIKNGLAKQKYERGFILQPGYIVEALNRARGEGKIVGPTKNSHKLKSEIKKTAAAMSVPRTHLSPAEFQRRADEQTRRMNSQKNSQNLLATV